MKVLLVTLTRDTREIEALIQSAGHELADTVVQVRDAPDRRYFVGKGKLEELADRLGSLDVDRVLFNGEVHPSQLPRTRASARGGASPPRGSRVLARLGPGQWFGGAPRKPLENRAAPGIV